MTTLKAADTSAKQTEFAAEARTMTDLQEDKARRHALQVQMDARKALLADASKHTL